MIRHVLLSLIASGGLFAFTGFILTMFGFSSPCNDPPHCSIINGQRILLYKVCGAILLVFGLLMAMLGITLKWRLQPEQLRLENRALSEEGTTFTGDTNLDVSPSSPVEETISSPSSCMKINTGSPTRAGVPLIVKSAFQERRFLSDVRDSRDGEGFSSSSSCFTPFLSSSGILERHPQLSPRCENHSSYPATRDNYVGADNEDDGIARNRTSSNNNADDDEDYGFDMVDSCALVVVGDIYTGENV